MISFKKLLPIENFTLVSAKPTEEILNRLSDNVMGYKKYRYRGFTSTYPKPYSGHINGSSFEITRNLDYRNSFVPIIKGHTYRQQGETFIVIRMRMHPITNVFGILWLGIVGVVCLGMILLAVLKIQQVLQDGFSPLVLIPFGLFIFGYSLFYFGFKHESEQSKEFLINLFEAQLRSNI